MVLVLCDCNAAGQNQIVDRYNRQWQLHAVQSTAWGAHPCQMLTPQSEKDYVQSGALLCKVHHVVNL